MNTIQSFLMSPVTMPWFIMVLIIVLIVGILFTLVRGILNQAEEIRHLRQRNYDRRENPSWLPDLINYWHKHADLPTTVVDQRIAICRCSSQLQEVAQMGFLPWLIKQASRKSPEPV